MNIIKRIKRLQNLIKRMNDGEDVALRDLKLALTTDERKDYEASVEQCRDLKKMLTEVPSELKKYAQLLKKAELLHNRAEAMAKSGNPRTRKRLFDQSEETYEKALEFLGEALQISPALSMLLDREFVQTPEKFCSPDPASVPRLVTSTSFYRERNLESLVGKRRSLKLDALQSSKESCQAGNEQSVSTENQPVKCVLPSQKAKKKIGRTDIKV